jgi:hypothetical protein
MTAQDPETVIACLKALQVFDVDDEGVHRPEPVLVRCWQHRR